MVSAMNIEPCMIRGWQIMLSAYRYVIQLACQKLHYLTILAILDMIVKLHNFESHIDAVMAVTVLPRSSARDVYKQSRLR